MLCDGLGHGPLAAAASGEAIAAVLEDPGQEPAALIERVHRRLGRTRGGAVGIVQVTGQTVQFAGLGNVAAWILADGDPRRACSRCRASPGTRPARSASIEYPVPAGAAIVLHSDGLSSRWDIARAARP